MGAVLEVVRTSSVRPSEDAVCLELRRIDPWGPARETIPMPQVVLDAVVPHYTAARETLGCRRTVIRAAKRRWASAIEGLCRQIQAGAVTW